MIVVDTNALCLLIIGLIDVRLIGKTRRVSIFGKEDFELM